MFTAIIIGLLVIEINHLMILKNIKISMPEGVPPMVAGPFEVLLLSLIHIFINGFSELVELEQDESKRNEYIQIIQNETKRINELVLAMLDLSKLESENISLDLEKLDLLDIVDELSLIHI